MVERQVEDNKELVQQLLNDVRAGCYEGCAIRITAQRTGGTNYKVTGLVHAIDLRGERFQIEEAQAIEGVPFREIRGYKWLD